MFYNYRPVLFHFCAYFTDLYILRLATLYLIVTPVVWVPLSYGSQKDSCQIIFPRVWQNYENYLISRLKLSQISSQCMFRVLGSWSRELRCVMYVMISSIFAPCAGISPNRFKARLGKTPPNFENLTIPRTINVLTLARSQYHARLELQCV